MTLRILALALMLFPSVVAAVASSLDNVGEYEASEMTVLITVRNQPVMGVRVDDIRVRANGDLADVTGLLGPNDAPLLLGVAIAGPALNNAPNLREHLIELSRKASAEGDDLFISAGGQDPELMLSWDEGSDRVATVLDRAGSISECHLARLVLSALKQFDEKSGRKILVVVTDGRDLASRTEWKPVLEVAAQSGIPILVAGYESERLTGRARRNLNHLSEVSGGKGYIVSDPGMLKMVFGHFGRLTEASAVLTFQREKEGSKPIYRLRMESELPEVVIRHSRIVR
ncbi:MAG: hypothetical protein GY906_36075 [bacterium]|nr:hypothetical protein [bacterium]